MNHRVAVMHGVNLDTLGRRDPAIYGTLTLTELEGRVRRFAEEFGFEASFFQTNHEGAFCEQLHRAAERSDAVVLNPAPGLTTRTRSATPWRWPRCPRWRCTSPPSRTGRTGAGTR